MPLPLTQTFSQYAQLGHRLRKHYLSPRVFICLISGQFVPPIHRKNLYSLQYSMLPAQRVGIGDLWKLLTEENAAAENGKSDHVNGIVNPPSLGRKAGAKARREGYWWSR